MIRKASPRESGDGSGRCQGSCAGTETGSASTGAEKVSVECKA